MSVGMTLTVIGVMGAGLGLAYLVAKSTRDPDPTPDPSTDLNDPRLDEHWPYYPEPRLAAPVEHSLSAARRDRNRPGNVEVIDTSVEFTDLDDSAPLSPLNLHNDVPIVVPPVIAPADLPIPDPVRTILDTKADGPPVEETRISVSTVSTDTTSVVSGSSSSSSSSSSNGSSYRGSSSSYSSGDSGSSSSYSSGDSGSSSSSSSSSSGGSSE